MSLEKEGIYIPTEETKKMNQHIRELVTTGFNGIYSADIDSFFEYKNGERTVKEKYKGHISSNILDDDKLSHSSIEEYEIYFKCVEIDRNTGKLKLNGFIGYGQGAHGEEEEYIPEDHLSRRSDIPDVLLPLLPESKKSSHNERSDKTGGTNRRTFDTLENVDDSEE